MKRALVVVVLTLAGFTVTVPAYGVDVPPPGPAPSDLSGTPVPGGPAPPGGQGLPTGRDCLEPPAPASPVHPFDAGPPNPREGTPWGENPESTIYEVYGYGPGPVEFDPGCNPLTLSWTPVAGWFHATGVNLLAGTATLWRYATDGSVGRVFDPVQQAVARMWTATGSGSTVTIIAALLTLSVLASGVYYVFTAHRSRLRDNTRASLTSIVVIAAGVAALFYPLVIGPALDSTLAGTVTALNTALGPATMTRGSLPEGASTGDAIAINTVDAVVYPAWRDETFGPENKAAADEFGPRLWAEAAYTRAEQKRLDGDPSAGKGMIEAKQAKFKEVARELEQKYPAAYQHLAGRHSLNQVSAASLAAFAAFLSVGFLVYGLARAVYGLIVARVAIAAAPGIMVIAQTPPGQPLFWRVLEWVWGALLMGVTAAVAAVVYVVVGVGGVLGAGNGLPMLVKIGLLLGLTVAAARLLHLGNKGVRRKLRGAADRADARGDRYQDPGDGERGRFRARATVDGARAGAATSFTAGVVTGGAVTAGAVTAGAVRGAATAAVTSGPTPRGGPARAVVHGPVYHPPALPPGPDPGRGGEAGPVSPAPRGGTPRKTPGGARGPSPGGPPRGGPARGPVQPARVYQPGEPNPSTGLRAAPRVGTGRVYEVTDAGKKVGA